MAALVKSWGYSPALPLSWLGFLPDVGHELSEAEIRLMDEARCGLEGDGEPEVADG